MQIVQSYLHFIYFLRFWNEPNLTDQSIKAMNSLPICFLPVQLRGKVMSNPSLNEFINEISSVCVILQNHGHP